MKTKANYGFGTTLSMPVEEAASKVKEALKTEGFGVLTEIDVQKTLREKLGEEMEPYLILGACNPTLAHKAITSEPEVGLLLPCNVVVRASGQESRVEIVDPDAMLGIAQAPELTEVAGEAKARLQRVIEALRR